MFVERQRKQPVTPAGVKPLYFGSLWFVGYKVKKILRIGVVTTKVAQRRHEDNYELRMGNYELVGLRGV